MTLALYMGKSIAAEVAGRLLAHGLAPSTPVGIAVNAGRQDSSAYRGTLGELAGDAIAFADGPAIILIGEAVEAGDWTLAAAFATQQVEAA
jgi:uroporphyrin-III C-methyltransferase/precorrin-2 dehydrogenase/sirohydrochlorin ferrochelatase